MSDQSFMYLLLHCNLLKGVAFGACISLLCVTAACSPEKHGEEPRVVLVATARAPLAPETVAVGTVRAAAAHDVPAQNGGRIVAFSADVGQKVRAGQVLAKIENRAETLALSQAESDYQRLRAVAVERGRNLQRMTALAKADAVSAADLDSAKSDAVSATRAAAAARDAVGLAQRNLDLTIIRSPSDGVVASRPVKLSDVLAAGTVVFEVDGTGAREITATTDESTASRLVEGTVYPFRNGTETGTARLIRVGERSGGTGARDILLQVSNGTVAPGTVVEVSLGGVHGGQAKALVPLGAISETSAPVRTVFVVGKDFRVHAVAVRLVSLGTSGAIVDGNIRPGATVVTAAAAFLRDGMLVRPVATAR